jgi:hypothetical protein
MSTVSADATPKIPNKTEAKDKHANTKRKRDTTYTTLLISSTSVQRQFL